MSELDYNLYSKFDFDPDNLGCVMLDFESWPDQMVFPKKNVLYDIDTNEYGIVEQPHVTLLYGLIKNANEISDEVDRVLQSVRFPDRVAIHQFAHFETAEYDVVYGLPTMDFRMICRDANQALARLPHITTHPNYQPHVTVAYVEKGFGERSIEEMKDRFYPPAGLLSLKMSVKGLNYGHPNE